MTASHPDRIQSATAVPRRRRIRLLLEGLVQGVGFRPFINQLALAQGLTGWVANSGSGVTAEVEGTDLAVDAFLSCLPKQLPPLARLDRQHMEDLACVGDASFAIRDSLSGGGQKALILPDVATCYDCLKEILNPTDRRFRYPFTNCTNCGPRFSIIEALPYDRANTTMRHFTMCASCRVEYDTPTNRRFHAQPNACPDCGPQLALLNLSGMALADRHSALLGAADALRDGMIVALKGLGGFQFLVDARNNDALVELRRRKGRPDKPFALMVPSVKLAESHCEVSILERELLTSSQAPIVLLRRRLCLIEGQSALAELVAPGNPMLGVMLPYTPLHHLLMRELGFPIVATSGNVSEEPMAIEAIDALDRLRGIADIFLVHDRPIASALDDSVVRVLANRKLVLRRARGYAPLPVKMKSTQPTVLALGGHMKSAAAMTVGANVIVGPHVGNLNTALARQTMHRTVDRLRGLHAICPTAVACDLHPEYYTTRAAQNYETKVIAVQHHVAHIASCIAENAVDGPVLGIAWDGTGYGTDGTIWGGEFIVVDGTSARRVAHLQTFSLPGGEKAMAEPRRAAIGLLYELFGEAALADSSLRPNQSFSATELKILGRMLIGNLNTPRTSSIGRMFDAVASLIGLAQRISFEGQAAMALEFAVDDRAAPRRYEVVLNRDCKIEGEVPMALDWRPMVRALLTDIEHGISSSQLATAFHEWLIDAIVLIAQRVGEPRVILTGGCFQNRYLAEGAIGRLRAAGFAPYWHQHVPPNDGGLALGQAVWAARLLYERAV